MKKPLIPIYFSLSSIQNPKKLIEEILLKPFNISENELIEFSNKYELLFIGDGYDEQEKQKWSNIYLENELYKFNSKLLITCRINALPNEYLPYFLPYRPGSDQTHDGYQEFYISSGWQKGTRCLYRCFGSRRRFSAKNPLSNE